MSSSWNRLSQEPWILTLLGAFFGIAIVSTIFPAQKVGDCAIKPSGVFLTQLLEQTPEPYYQPTVKLRASKPLFQELPPGLANTYTVDCFNFKDSCHQLQRSLRQLGQVKNDEWNVSRMIFMDASIRAGHRDLESWQRYNFVPNRTAFIKRERFLAGIQEYRDRGNAVKFLPDTYRLYNDDERSSLIRALKRKAGPWILHEGVRRMESPRRTYSSKKQITEALKRSKDEQENDKLLVQPYICNQLTWHGRQFLVRVFWLVASLDPLVVLYQDGFVRAGYNHSLTHILETDKELFTFDDFENYLNKKKQKSRRLREDLRHVRDPIVHVRNQFKASLATVVDIFREQGFHKPHQGKAEDGFEYFAADFIVDEDLDVWLHELFSQSMPAANRNEHYSFLMEDYYFQLKKYHEILYGMGLTLQEIWDKQSKNANLLPLRTTGKWQLIVAGDAWKFEDENIDQRDSRKIASSCKIYRDKDHS